MDNYGRYKEVKFNTIRDRKMLNSHLITPSLEYSYSLCVEYMKNWFLKRFDKNFFGENYSNIAVDESHIFSDFRALTKEQLIMRAAPEKGVLSIVPTIDDSFNRDNLEDAMYGVDMMVKRSRYEDSFFKDKAVNRYISSTLDLIFMNFTFKVRVESLAQQLDLFKRMKQTFRVGYTQGEYINMDYILPRELIVNIAKDNGFEVKDYDVVDTIGFLSYMNSHSQLPILYKHRNVNGRNEYFVRMEHMYVWLKASEITRDQGDRIGHLKTNYTIDMQCEVRFPSAQYYIYHTDNSELEAVPLGVVTGFAPVYSFDIFDIPDVNNKGWNSYLMSDYDDEENIKLNIEFEEFFKDTEIEKLIKHSLDIHVSPELFIDIHVFNDGVDHAVTMDWDTLVMNTIEPVTRNRSRIVIYMDLEYVNAHRVAANKLLESSMKSEKRG